MKGRCKNDYSKKVLVVNHQTAQCQVVRLIKNTDQLIYVGTVCQAKQVDEEIKRTGIDLLFINPKMLDGKPLHFIRSIKKRFSHLNLVIFANQDHQLFSQLIEIELIGYLLNTEKEEALLLALDRIANNKPYYSQDAILPILSSTRKIKIQLSLAKLTQRERQILPLIGQKLSNHQIAKQLKLAPNTIRTHLNNLYHKLALRSRQEAIDYATAVISYL